MVQKQQIFANVNAMTICIN